jgi:MoaA/NifB/PqqE/SkfB family radical SAM enzyme
MIAIDYMITSNCNLNCPFCYGSQGVIEMTSEQKLQLIKEVSLLDNIFLIISGGEPLSSPDIVNVCSYAKQNGIKIAIQTNGTYLNVLKQILPYVDWIGLPIDGISSDVCKKTRTIKNHFDKVRESIKIIESYKKDNNTNTPLIKIGTVLTKYNAGQINDIFSFLTKHQIEVWKIYKIRQRGKMAIENSYKSICLREDEILNISNKINGLQSNLKIYFSNDNANDSYVIIEPNSEIIVINGKNQYSCGTLITDSKISISTLKQALQKVDLEKICDNINKSFPQWR